MNSMPEVVIKLGVANQPKEKSLFRRVTPNQLARSGLGPVETLKKHGILLSNGVFQDIEVNLDCYQVSLSYVDLDGDNVLICEREDLEAAMKEYSKSGKVKVFALVEKKAVKPSVKSAPSPAVDNSTQTARCPYSQTPKPMKVADAVESIVGTIATATVIAANQVHKSMKDSKRVNVESAGLQECTEATKTEETAKPDKDQEAAEAAGDCEKDQRKPAYSEGNGDESETPFVHGRHTCDTCLATPIIGKRYHSHPDFDLCESCYKEYDGDRRFEPVELECDRLFQTRWARRFSHQNGRGAGRRGRLGPRGGRARQNRGRGYRIQPQTPPHVSSKGDSPHEGMPHGPPPHGFPHGPPHHHGPPPHGFPHGPPHHHGPPQHGFPHGPPHHHGPPPYGDAFPGVPPLVDNGKFVDLPRASSPPTNGPDVSVKVPIDEAKTVDPVVHEAVRLNKENDEKAEGADLGQSSSSLSKDEPIASTSKSPKSEVSDHSFAKDAEGFGTVAENLGETLDKFANEITEMTLELDGRVGSSVDSVETEASIDNDGRDSEAAGATIVEGTEEEAGEVASRTSWQVVTDNGEEESLEGINGFARATQAIGSALFNSDMERSSQEQTIATESVSTTVSIPTTIQSLNVEKDSISSYQLERWSVQLSKLHELGFLNDAANVETIERLAAANIGVNDVGEVTVQQVIDEIMKDW